MPTEASTTAAQTITTAEHPLGAKHDDENHFRITGSLSSNADTRLFASGTSLTRLTVTVRSDQGHPRVDVVPVSVWNARAAIQRGRRGDRVEVEGRVQRRFWTRPDGARDSRLELVANSIDLARS